MYSDFGEILDDIYSNGKEQLDLFFEKKSDEKFVEIVERFIEEERDNESCNFGPTRPDILKCILRQVMSRKVHLDEHLMHDIVFLVASWPDSVDGFLEFSCLDVNVFVDLYDTTPLMTMLFCHQSNRVVSLLAHPMIQVNKRNNTGKAAIHCCQSVGCLDILLSDPRVFLSSQDEHGRTVMDLNLSDWEWAEDDYYDSYEEWKENYVDDVKKIIRSHELTRFTKAKKEISLLNKFLPEDLLSEHVLPYLADVISPVEELEADIELKKLSTAKVNKRFKKNVTPSSRQKRKPPMKCTVVKKVRVTKPIRPKATKPKTFKKGTKKVAATNKAKKQPVKKTNIAKKKVINKKTIKKLANKKKAVVTKKKTVKKSATCTKKKAITKKKAARKAKTATAAKKKTTKGSTSSN
eukprot:gene441-893_t